MLYNLFEPLAERFYQRRSEINISNANPNRGSACKTIGSFELTVRNTHDFCSRHGNREVSGQYQWHNILWGTSKNLQFIWGTKESAEHDQWQVCMGQVCMVDDQRDTTGGEEEAKCAPKRCIEAGIEPQPVITGLIRSKQFKCCNFWHVDPVQAGFPHVFLGVGTWDTKAARDVAPAPRAPTWRFKLKTHHTTNGGVRAKSWTSPNLRDLSSPVIFMDFLLTQKWSFWCSKIKHISEARSSRTCAQRCQNANQHLHDGAIKPTRGYRWTQVESDMLAYFQIDDNRCAFNSQTCFSWATLLRSLWHCQLLPFTELSGAQKDSIVKTKTKKASLNGLRARSACSNLNEVRHHKHKCQATKSKHVYSIMKWSSGAYTQLWHRGSCKTSMGPRWRHENLVWLIYVYNIYTVRMFISMYCIFVYWNMCLNVCMYRVCVYNANI